MQVRVLVIEPGELPEVREVEHDDLKAFQALVGGYVETVNLTSDIMLICNEEGKLKGLPGNRYIRELDDVIVGIFLICRYNDEGEVISLTDKDISHYSKIFSSTSVTLR